MSLQPAQPAGPAQGPEGSHQPVWQELWGWHCSSQQLCWLRVLWGHSQSTESVTRTRRVGRWLGFCLLQQHCFLQELWKETSVPQVLFFPRGFHEDSCICPCSSLQPPAVNSPCCKTCCSQVSLSHVQQWPGRSGAGGRAEPGFASCSPSRRLWFFHCCSS